MSNQIIVLKKGRTRHPKFGGFRTMREAAECIGTKYGEMRKAKKNGHKINGWEILFISGTEATEHAAKAPIDKGGIIGVHANACMVNDANALQYEHEGRKKYNLLNTYKK